MKSGRAVLLCGPPGSGKTTAAWYLECIGFGTVNVGRVVRQICARKGLPTSRAALEEFGRRYLCNEDDAEELVSELFVHLGAARDIAVDGVRPRRIISLLKETYSETKIVYLQARTSVLVGRLMRRGMTQPEAMRTLEAPLEEEGARIKYLADHVLENEGPLCETLRAIHVIAVHKAMGPGPGQNDSPGPKTF